MCAKTTKLNVFYLNLGFNQREIKLNFISNYKVEQVFVSIKTGIVSKFNLAAWLNF